MEEKRIIEIIIKHKIEYEKGILEYLRNLVFRLIKIWIIFFIIRIITKNINFPTSLNIF